LVNTALQEKVDPNRLPRHVAIIMDGNGRWAQNHSLPRVEGHWEGVKAVDRIVTLSRKLKLEALTLYSFSDENWNRPSVEISTLMKILDYYLKKELKRIKEENIRFNTIGHIEDLPETIQKIDPSFHRRYLQQYRHGSYPGTELRRQAGNHRCGKKNCRTGAFGTAQA